MWRPGGHDRVFVSMVAAPLVNTWLDASWLLVTSRCNSHVMQTEFCFWTPNRLCCICCGTLWSQYWRHKVGQNCNIVTTLFCLGVWLARPVSETSVAHRQVDCTLQCDVIFGPDPWELAVKLYPGKWRSALCFDLLQFSKAVTHTNLQSLTPFISLYETGDVTFVVRQWSELCFPAVYCFCGAP